ncbi:MAG: hypothetical protein ABSE49_17750 [Polyangiaceae bacterium]
MAATNGLRRGALLLLPPLMLGCVSVDPGPDFVVPETVFDQNYFYCFVEPGIMLNPMYACGSGDPSKGDPSNGCHFNPSAVSGMILIDHPVIDCGGGDVPLDPTQVGSGSPAFSNFQNVSLEMSIDWQTSALFTRPSSYNGVPPAAHPRAIFDQSDMNVQMLLSTWATK